LQSPRQIRPLSAAFRQPFGSLSAAPRLGNSATPRHNRTFGRTMDALQNEDVTTLEADSVQTIRSLEHYIATIDSRVLNNALRLSEQSVGKPLSDAHVKILSLTTALQHEQDKNNVLTVCNAQLEAALAERADERQPVQLKVNVAASSSNCSGKRKRDDDEVACAKPQLERMSKQLAMQRLANKKLHKDNDFLKGAFEDLVESAHCLLASIQEQNDNVKKISGVFENTLNNALQRASSKQ
jgi:hypothetical protein